VLRTTTRVGTAMTPYGVLADLAREILGLADGAEPHEVQRRLALAVPLIFPGEEDGKEARAALAAVSVLLGVRTPDASDGDPGERRQRLLGLVTKVEHHLEADKPLIIVGEDVHWSDQESLEIFTSLLQVATSRAVLGIVTSRPDKRIIDAATAAGADVVHVDELADTARRQLLASRFAPDDDVDELAEQILARAGGNPFFILEQLDALAEREIITPAAGHPGRYRWTQRDAAIQVPTSIEDLLITRIDRLPERDKQTLLLAAVFGRVVGPPALAALLGRQVKGELDDLCRRGLLQPHEGEYRFKNDTIMTVAYGLSPRRGQDPAAPPARGDRIATGPSYRPGPTTPTSRATSSWPATPSPPPSATCARRPTPSTSAATPTRSASSAARSSCCRPAITRGGSRRGASARRSCGAWPGARSSCASCRRCARRPRRSAIHSKQALAHALLAQFYIDVGKAPAAQRAVTPALQFARDAGDKPRRGRRAAPARRDRAAGRLQRRLAQAVRAGADALHRARPATAPRRSCCARADLERAGHDAVAHGPPRAAIEAYAEALVIYRALRLPRQEARALNHMGNVFAALGEYEEALAHYKSRLKIDQQLGDRSGVAFKLGNIGQCVRRPRRRRPRRELPGQGHLARRADRRSVRQRRRRDLVGPGQAGARRRRRRARAARARPVDLASENRERYQEIRGARVHRAGAARAPTTTPPARSSWRARPPSWRARCR
jgi:tetratricopeptide (TPR) repeat protein